MFLFYLVTFISVNYVIYLCMPMSGKDVSILYITRWERMENLIFYLNSVLTAQVLNIT